MSPVGRRLKIGDYVLLPKGTSAAPYNGILYGKIMDTCMLEKDNKFNASVSKRRLGWEVLISTNDDTQDLVVRIPKTYPLIQYCSTELEVENELRPKELLGMFVGRGLMDKHGKEHINYGQVHGVTVREGVSYCTVVFRKLPDGSAITNMEFPGEDLMEFEVSLLQFTLGVGVGTVFANADRRVTTLRSILENMSPHDDHDQWIKEVDSLSVAREDQKVLDPFLEAVEISLPKILSNWPALARYLPVVVLKKKSALAVTKDLRVEFELNDGFGECISGNPVTPVRVEASLQSQNARRQEHRASAVPQVLPLSRTIKPMDSTRSLDHQVEVQRENIDRLQISPGGYGAPSSSVHASNYSKHSYHPSHSQLQKHMITFKDGTYGKSYTLEEATAGIEVVLSQEMLHTVKADEAHIRSWCIMNGDLMLAPFWTWRNATLLANNFEEHYIPVKWSKLPDLKAMEVVDMDEFWVLYHSMEQAAARYYVDSYCLLLAHCRHNIQEGFMVVGGRAGFIGMRMAVRRNVIHVLVAYLRHIVNLFFIQVLSVDGNPSEWMAREASDISPIYDRLVRTRLTNLQLSDLTARAATAAYGGGQGNNHGGGGGNGHQPKGDSEWSSTMPKELRATIPKQEGKNMCLMSYTRQGCKGKNDGCAYFHKKVGSPAFPGPLSAWIEKTYGSYVGP